MRPSEAIKGKTDEIRKTIESYGLLAPAIFGSTARAEDEEGSDPDLLATIPVEMAGKISLFDIADTQDKLEQMLGVVVDFNVENNLPETYMASIELQMIKL
jgi:predicted nucleotidyltransferase